MYFCRLKSDRKDKNMPLQENCFTSFKESTDSYVLPERFTFPFYYEPHPLCLLAAKELQHYLETQLEWQHNFGIAENEKDPVGKMFGVLLVQNKQKKIGYLTAFSGKLAGVNHLSSFVPPVYDMLKEDGFYKQEEIKLNRLTNEIEALEKNPKIKELKESLEIEKELSVKSISEFRGVIIESRKKRKIKRADAEKKLDPAAYLRIKEGLAKESTKQKNELKKRITYWEERTQKIVTDLEEIISKIEFIKDHRKNISNALQKKLFDQYHFLNSNGDKKSLCDIFKETPQGIPPAAAGECAAPKLLQYAFEHQLKPLAMAEFWWGESPKSAIRKHRLFYPACQGKCQPILGHMLQGMNLDENPLLNNPADGKNIEIVYEDEELLLINKPAEFLSVPGKTIQDSVYLRMKMQFPKATGPLIVHRLDMSTSGLMIIAKSKDTHKYLQKQFIKRSVKKRYVALLDGLIEEDEGIIDLPLRVDLDDRPRQLVCYEHGKPAKTKWEVIERSNNKTKVYFYPITGRTHQLRVHSAHVKGLNTAILGDDLYGRKSDRLHLHAEAIEFNHPTTKELMRFEVKAKF